MLKQSLLISALVLLTNLITPNSSSAVINSDNCLNLRSKFFLSIRDYISEKNIKLEGHEIELERITSEIATLQDQIETNSIEINAKAAYNSSVNNFGDTEPSQTKNSDIGLSLSVPLSVEERWSKSKLRKSLQRSLEYKNLVITRQQGDAMSHLLQIFNLKNLYLNALRKLPIIFEQIEYYELRQKIGASNVRELSRAEMSKLKIENEIINLKARIDVELSKLMSPETLSLNDLTHIPKFQYQFTEVPQFDCSFYDPELELKQLDVQIKEIERDIARARELPTANMAFGISSRDSHSGPHANNYSIGLSVSGPLYSGGNNKAHMENAERKLHLAFMELSAHKEKFKKKRANFLSLEKSLLRSIEQARQQSEANELEIDELTARKNAGFSVFEDLSERKLQRVELDGISFDLHNRLASFWVTYLENLSE